MSASPLLPPGPGRAPSPAPGPAPVAEAPAKTKAAAITTPAAPAPAAEAPAATTAAAEAPAATKAADPAPEPPAPQTAVGGQDVGYTAAAPAGIGGDVPAIGGQANWGEPATDQELNDLFIELWNKEHLKSFGNQPESASSSAVQPPGLQQPQPAVGGQDVGYTAPAGIGGDVPAIGGDVPAIGGGTLAESSESEEAEDLEDPAAEESDWTADQMAAWEAEVAAARRSHPIQKKRAPGERFWSRFRSYDLPSPTQQSPAWLVLALSQWLGFRSQTNFHNGPDQMTSRQLGFEKNDDKQLGASPLGDEGAGGGEPVSDGASAMGTING